MTHFSGDIEVFYDGDCVVCSREMALLQRMDHDGRIRFTNIASEGFDARNAPRTTDQLLGSIHARFADGRVISGVEVFRELYSRVGFTRLVALSRMPFVSHVLDRAYDAFSRKRPLLRVAR